MTTADETYDFTDQKLKVIFAMCSGLTKTNIAQLYRIAEEIVGITMTSIFDKAGFSTRFELFEFAKTALVGELRRRKGHS